MTNPTRFHAGLIAGCLLLSVFTTSLLAGPIPDSSDSDEEAARQGHTVRGGGVTRTVGPDADCDFSGLQNALDSAGDGDTIRVMSGTYTGGFSIAEKSLTVRGGFPDCNSSTPTGSSTLDGGGSNLVLDIYYTPTLFDPARQVLVENMIIQNGGRGGALVEGQPGEFSVDFRNVEIRGNSRANAPEHGAGLRVVSSDDSGGSEPTFVTLDNDSVVASNTTDGDGGGVYCESSYDDGTVTMLRMGTTPVIDNEAENGGGIAVNGCQNVFLYNGGPNSAFSYAGGFVGNSAADGGGAIYVENGGEVFLRASAAAGFGDIEEAALLANNTAVDGGAAEVTGEGSSLSIQDAYVFGNTADRFGGAFRVSQGGELSVGRKAGTGACEPIESVGGVVSRPPCSVIEENEGTSGGAFSLAGESSIDVSRSIVRNNTAGGGGGPVALVRNASIYTGEVSDFFMASSVVHGNSGIFLFDATNNARIRIYYSTIVDNSETFGRVGAFEEEQLGDIEVFSSIVETSEWLSTFGDGTLDFQLNCVIGSTPLAETDATSSFAYSDVDPQFVDATENDYRLQARSPAIDYCDDTNAPGSRDLDGNPRGEAWTGPNPDSVPDPEASGDFDLGAFETPFEVQNVDLAVESTAPAAFVGGANSFTLELELTNQGSNTAFADISVIDEFTSGAVVNQQWTCTAPAGVSCSPASGSGNIDTDVSDLEPGQSVTFEVTAASASPGTDEEFDYTMIATESQFNEDPDPSNNEATIEIRTGLFSDGFESGP